MMIATKRVAKVLAAGGAVAALVLATAGTSQAAPAGNKAFSGYSHDIKSYTAGVLTNGPVAEAGVGCSDTAPLFYQDSAAAVTLAGVTLGTDTVSSQASKTGNVQNNTSTFQATGLSIPLTGFNLTADAVTISSTTTYDTTTGVFTTGSTMSVTNLLVKAPLLPAILSISGPVSPNFGFAIPGVGQLTLNATQVLGSQAFGAVGIMATGIKLALLGTVSTSVGETYASLYGTPDQTYMFGEGQGLTVATTNVPLQVGPLVVATLPCAGNGGNTATVLGVNGLPATLGSLGAITSTATGSQSGQTADATTTSQVAGVNLLGGLVTADTVSSTSHVTTSDGATTVSKTGSGSVFANLKIGGVTINPLSAPNTFVALPGVGYVIVNAQTTYTLGIEIIPLVVHVNATNSLGLPAAIDVLVARSYAILLGPGAAPAATRQATSFLQNGTTKSKLLSNSQKQGAGLTYSTKVLPKVGK